MSVVEDLTETALKTLDATCDALKKPQPATTAPNSRLRSGSRSAAVGRQMGWIPAVKSTSAILTKATSK